MKKLIILSLFIISGIISHAQYEEIINNDVIIYGKLEMDSLQDGFVLKSYSGMIPTPIQGLLLYDAGINAFLIGNGVTFDTIGSSNANLAMTDFSGEKLLRDWPTGYTCTGTIQEDWEYRLFTPPTMSALTFAPTTTLYEVGDSARIRISGTTSNLGGATLSNGYLFVATIPPDTLDQFTSSTSYDTIFDFEPTQAATGDYHAHSYIFSAQQYYTNADPSESGTITSATETVDACYKYFYGVCVTDLEGATGTTVYDSLTGVLEKEGDKTVTLTGYGYAYFVYDSTWTNISEILDANDFPVFTSFQQTGCAVSPSAGHSLENPFANKGMKMIRAINPGNYTGVNYEFK